MSSIERAAFMEKYDKKMIKDVYSLFNKFLDITFLDLENQKKEMDSIMNRFEQRTSNDKKFMVKMLKVLMNIETNKIKIY